MRTFSLLALALCCTLSSGCFGKNVAGTWIKDKSSEANSPIAAVSFCDDGTFTAHAEYGDTTTRVVSGHWHVDRDTLHLDVEGIQRQYHVAIQTDTMILTHEDTQSRMMRLKGR